MVRRRNSPKWDMGLAEQAALAGGWIPISFGTAGVCSMSSAAAGLAGLRLLSLFLGIQVLFCFAF